MHRKDPLLLKSSTDLREVAPPVTMMALLSSGMSASVVEEVDNMAVEVFNVVNVVAFVRFNVVGFVVVNIDAVVEFFVVNTALVEDDDEEGNSNSGVDDTNGSVLTIGVVNNDAKDDNDC